MGDIQVHVRLRKCCREALADIDARKAKARFTAGVLGTQSLEAAFGDHPVERATKLVPAGSPQLESTRLQSKVREVCRAVAQEHRALHEGSTERMEAAFWTALEDTLTREHVHESGTEGDAAHLGRQT